MNNPTTDEQKSRQRDWSRKYREKNLQKVREKDRARDIARRESRYEQQSRTQRSYYERNRKHVLARRRKYVEQNRELINARKRGVRSIGSLGGNSGKPWTDDERHLALDPNLTDIEKALLLGRSVNAVAQQRRRTETEIAA